MKNLQPLLLTLILLLSMTTLFAETCPSSLQITKNQNGQFSIDVPNGYDMSNVTPLRFHKAIHLMRTTVFLDDTVACTYNHHITISKRGNKAVEAVQNNPHWERAKDMFTCLHKTNENINYCQF